MNSPISNSLPRVGKSLLVLIFAAFVLAASSAFAGDKVPFYSVHDTEFESVIESGIASVHVWGGGKASHMGKVAIETTDQVVNLITGVGTATYRYVAANGDYLDFYFDEVFVPAPGGFSFTGTWTVVGGSGRFMGASGSGINWGTATFTGETVGVGHFEMLGEISSVGSLK